MSKEVLKTLRLIVPGTMIVIGCLPVFLGITEIAATIHGNETLLLILTPAVAGAVYYIWGLRGYFIRPALVKINVRITSTLLRPFSHHPIIGAASTQLARGRTVLNVFYHFVDNDNTLGERAKNVHLNGLMLSSVADLRAITIFLLLPIYIISYLVTKNWHFLLFAGIAVLLNVIGKFLMSEVTKTHIDLGAQQTEFILQFYRDDLEQRLIEAVSH